MNINEVTNNSFNVSNAVVSNSQQRIVESNKTISVAENIQLGTWLLGLVSYVNTQNHSFHDGNREKASVRDWSNDIKIIHSTLLTCGMLTSKLSFETDMLLGNKSDFQLLIDSEYTKSELNQLSKLLQNFTILCETLLRSKKIEFYEWTAFCNIFSNALTQSETFEKIILKLNQHNENSLPKTFLNAFDKQNIPSHILADLQIVVPYFARILGCLNFIEKQLEVDKPLKPTLVLFTIIFDYAKEMIDFLKNRLIRFNDEQVQMSDILDCTVFATSIEIRKVFQNELSEVSSIRQAPILRSRIDAAYGLLRDCFQQNFLLFAQSIEPEISAHELFPNIKTKLEQSISLRADLWSVLKDVQNAEKNIENFPLSSLLAKLNDFAAGSMKFLMYKDTETVERFIEELFRTQNESDLIALLHRFGAYIETLFGQVNMRTILSDHPFEM